MPWSTWTRLAFCHVPASIYAYSNSAWQNYSVMASGLVDPNAGNSTDSLVGKELQSSVTDVGLRFRWPVLPSGQVGTSRESFRSTVSGTNLTTLGGGATLFFIQPQTFGSAQ